MCGWFSFPAASIQEVMTDAGPLRLPSTVLVTKWFFSRLKMCTSGILRSQNESARDSISHVCM